MEKQTEPKKNDNSHANFKKGLNDYNDGANVTHHLGNNDYPNGTNAPDDQAEDFDGSVANGNDLSQTDTEDEDDV